MTREDCEKRVEEIVVKAKDECKFGTLSKTQTALGALQSHAADWLFELESLKAKLGELKLGDEKRND